MRQILAINPRRKKPGKRRKKGAAVMPKGKSTKKRAKRNPARAKKYARAAGGRMMSGLSIKKALGDQVPIQIGMLASKWAEKRFGPEASDYDPTTWSWASYAKGGLGALVAAMVSNMVKPGWGQKVLTGGISQVLNRLIRNELIEKSPFAISQLGQSDDAIIVDDDGTPYVGDDAGQYLPVDESYRIGPGSMMGDSLVDPGPLGMLEPVGPLGSSDFERYAQAYSE